MTRGRKHRWVRAGLLTLSGLACAAALAPVAPAATPAADEYDLALPNADGGNTDSAAGTAGSSEPPAADGSSVATAATPAATTASPAVEAEPAGAGGVSSAGSGNQGQQKPADPKADGRASDGGAAASEPTASLPQDDSGGVPILLIALAALAATAVGVAVWRLRGGGRGSPVTTPPSEITRGA
jgi:cobalamin biosynthesis Mg chelatase CobN